MSPLSLRIPDRTQLREAVTFYILRGNAFSEINKFTTSTLHLPVTTGSKSTRALQSPGATSLLSWLALRGGPLYPIQPHLPPGPEATAMYWGVFGILLVQYPFLLHLSIALCFQYQFLLKLPVALCFHYYVSFGCCFAAVRHPKT